MNHKNPFRGIACSNGSHYPLNFFRHIEGARDSRPTYHTRHRGQLLLRAFVDRTLVIGPFRDVNAHPVMFNT